MNKRILIVEDSLPAMMVEKMLIKSFGFEVDGAETGHKAIEFVMKNHDQYGLILLDLGLPDLTGKQVCEKIRAYEKDSNLAHIPISS